VLASEDLGQRRCDALQLRGGRALRSEPSVCPRPGNLSQRDLSRPGAEIERELLSRFKEATQDGASTDSLRSPPASSATRANTGREEETRPGAGLRFTLTATGRVRGGYLPKELGAGRTTGQAEQAKRRIVRLARLRHRTRAPWDRRFRSGRGASSISERAMRSRQRAWGHVRLAFRANPGGQGRARRADRRRACHLLLEAPRAVSQRGGHAPTN